MSIIGFRMNTPHEYVQYGCGFCAPKRWLNFDASPTLRFERIWVLGRFYTKNRQRFPDEVRYGDIVRGLPVSAKSCKLVYCSHVLEHLALADMRIALKNTHRILMAGGIFRFVLPDLEFLARRYLEDSSPNAAMKFLQDSYLGRERRPRRLRSFVYEWLRTSAHLWMWDFKSIEKELFDAGFINIRRASMGDGEDQLLDDVETQDRWENCLGVTCQRPE